MGSTAIVFSVVGTVVALVCLLVGFLWGRSNLKARVEQALEDGHGGLDFREFAIRQQLDEAVAEVARLRPLAEEYGRVQERLRREQAQYDQMKTDFDASLKAAGQESDSRGSDQVAAPAPVSADEAIQKLLKSLELTLNEPEEQAQAPVEPLQARVEPPPAIEKQAAVVATPPPAPREEPPVPRVQPAAAAAQPAVHRAQPSAPRVQRPAATAQPNPAVASSRKPEPKAPQKPESAAPGVDEWQEFARSLADLTRRNQ